jgi:hypothetical protein
LLFAGEFGSTSPNQALRSTLCVIIVTHQDAR